MGLAIVFFASRLDFPPVEAFLDTRLFFDIKIGRFATAGTTAQGLGHDEQLRKEEQVCRVGGVFGTHPCCRGWVPKTPPTLPSGCIMTIALGGGKELNESMFGRAPIEAAGKLSSGNAWTSQAYSQG